MLRVEALQVRRGDKTVLADVTLDLLPGEVLGVLGAHSAASARSIFSARRMTMELRSERSASSTLLPYPRPT